MITSKLTSKAQTTIPQAVRTALGVGPGDEIAYAIVEGHVLLTKATRPRRGAPFEDPFAFFRDGIGPKTTKPSAISDERRAEGRHRSLGYRSRRFSLRRSGRDAA